MTYTTAQVLHSPQLSPPVRLLVHTQHPLQTTPAAPASATPTTHVSTEERVCLARVEVSPVHVFLEKAARTVLNQVQGGLIYSKKYIFPI